MKTLKEKKESQEIYEGITKTAKPIISSKVFKLLHHTLGTHENKNLES